MAKNDTNIQPDYVPSGFDMTGFDEKDLREVGSFTPMYKPKNAYEGKYAPVKGWLACCEPLPKIEGKNESDPDRVPLTAHVVLHKPNKGILGPRGEERIVELKAGESILVPIGGNLLFNKPFISALFDPLHAWYVVMSVVGTRPSDYPSDTWVWKVELSPRKFERSKTNEPRFVMAQTALTPEVFADLPEKTRKQLPSTAIMRGQVVGRTSGGQLYDSDGVIVERSISAQA